MHIYFHTPHIQLDPDFKDHVARRLEGLSKFFPEEARAYVDIEMANGQHRGNDICYTSIKIESAGYVYFTEEYQSSIRISFDHAYGEIFRIIRSDRSRSRRLGRRAAQKIKRIFKRQK